LKDVIKSEMETAARQKERDLFHATQSLETSSCAFPPASRISNKSDLRS